MREKRMSDMQTFPDTVDEFMEHYKIVDTEQVYTNGVELVPIFRMKQWFEHSERKKGKWAEVKFRTIPYNRISKAKKCSVCGKNKDKYVTWNFCPNCGADMRGDTDETDS